MLPDDNSHAGTTTLRLRSASSFSPVKSDYNVFPNFQSNEAKKLDSRAEAKSFFSIRQTTINSHELNGDIQIISIIKHRNLQSRSLLAVVKIRIRSVREL